MYPITPRYAISVIYDYRNFAGRDSQIIIKLSLCLTLLMIAPICVSLLQSSSMNSYTQNTNKKIAMKFIIDDINNNNNNNNRINDNNSDTDISSSSPTRDNKITNNSNTSNSPTKLKTSTSMWNAFKNSFKFTSTSKNSSTSTLLPDVSSTNNNSNTVNNATTTSSTSNSNNDATNFNTTEIVLLNRIQQAKNNQIAIKLIFSLMNCSLAFFLASYQVILILL